MSEPPSLLRLATVLARTGLSRSVLYRMMDAGRFPRPLRIIGTTTRAWNSDDVTEWCQFQIANARRDGETSNLQETPNA